MENSPHPDFEMLFYSGIKVHVSSLNQQISMTLPNASTQSETVIRRNLTDLCEANLPQNQCLALKHAQECLKQCLDVEQSITSEQSKFPVIIKSSRCPSSGSGERPTSPTLSLHPSAISSYSVSGQSNTKERNGASVSGKENFPHGMPLNACKIDHRLFLWCSDRKPARRDQTFSQKQCTA